MRVSATGCTATFVSVRCNVVLGAVSAFKSTSHLGIIFVVFRCMSTENALYSQLKQCFSNF